MGLLFVWHLVPDLCSLSIDMDIEELGTNENHEVVSADGNQNLVASSVERFVLFSVDLNRRLADVWMIQGADTHVRSDDTACLYTHVVEGGSYCTRSDGTSISTGNGDEDCVNIRIAKEKDTQDVLDPVTNVAWYHFESDQKWQCPDLTHPEHILVKVLHQCGSKLTIQSGDVVQLVQIAMSKTIIGW
jgi:hypothetical protein